MNQSERRSFLLKSLLDEQEQYRDIEIPKSTQEQKTLLRALMNVRMPKSVSGEFLRVQDEYLQRETILHTVRPIVQGKLTEQDCAQLVPVYKA